MEIELYKIECKNGKNSNVKGRTIKVGL